MTQKRYGYVIVNSRSGKWLSLDERWTKSLKSAIILKSPDNLEGFATNATTPIPIKSDAQIKQELADYENGLRKLKGK